MRRSERLMISAVLISLCGMLAGCGGGGLNNWDPTDMFNFLDTKKKMPGNRQPVFPNGVPGIEQGGPMELYKSDVGLQQAQEQAAAAAAPSPSDEPEQARRQGAADGSSRRAGAADSRTAAAPRKPKRLVHRRATSLPKEEAPPAQQAEPAAASSFPAPLPSGSFSR